MSRVQNVFRRMIDKMSGRASSGASDASWLPPVVYPDDLFIVSYPKSGNTWMRFLFANLLRASRDEVVTFRTAIGYAPEVGKHHAEIAAARRPRILKSHATVYVPAYPKVIYVIRDPRDVYVSYYFYMKKRLPPEMTISEFIRSSEHKLGDWSTHVANWLNRDNTLQVLYEEMLTDVEGVVTRVLSFWGQRQFDRDWILAAIEASSFGRMQEVEQQAGHQVLDERGTSWETAFMRRGVQGDWQEHLNADDLAYIDRIDGDMMRRLSYD